MKTKRLLLLLAVALVSSAIAAYSVQFLRKEATTSSSRPMLMIEAMARRSSETPATTTPLAGARRSRSVAGNSRMGAVTVRVNDRDGVMRYVRRRHRVDLILPSARGTPDTILQNMVVIGKGTTLEKDGSGNRFIARTLLVLVTPAERKLLQAAEARGALTFVLKDFLREFAQGEVNDSTMRAVTIYVNFRPGAAGFLLPKQRVDITIPAGDGMPETIIRNLTVIGSGTESERNRSRNFAVRATLSLLVTAEEAKLLNGAKARGPMTFTFAGAGWVSQSAPNPPVR